MRRSTRFLKEWDSSIVIVYLNLLSYYLTFIIKFTKVDVHFHFNAIAWMIDNLLRNSSGNPWKSAALQAAPTVTLFAAFLGILLAASYYLMNSRLHVT